ncbi:Fpg/Nei family DNA glycosylase [Euzebya rosea]|uniref:Fpg/Nei family DNA glycosylase n=1 Tax=Euzebya rosea TaxID=2052804 RepID=UPI000D3EA154|nr:DNA-formamidopyrimidine glycosylase family protein [Euzebya rosea]
MPEGDTIFRAAATLQRAMAGKVITGVDTTVPQVRRLMPERLVGQTVERVEARGKHLLHWFAPSGLALHTHMRMTGSWHTYPPGGKWRKPAHFAKLVLRTADVEAVAFSVPVVELLSAAQVASHRAIANLGPDPLHVPEGEQLDLPESRKRLDTLADTPIGVALLDQRVLAGVGNVYRNEVLFICRVDPWTPVAEVPPEVRDRLLAVSAALLQANIAHGGSGRITTRPPAQVARLTGRQRGSESVWVYGKAGRPCPRCSTPIRSASLGDHARVTYWCPSCQGPGPRRR